ncbi:unnamed protein product [Bursaphelenchus okinawaensis]|uniref:PHD-type domain-containing protein n=1 Tax=Bursaphelenchus okinawaensis TaxID=465554 RepID=A0A811K7V4_9BILA|nr:unnamed protein product [Bursaphelenchus okinawaensis]CAG9093410.1 unnamed protein product [Bursaphelenchus okinawaensis]
MHYLEDNLELADGTSVVFKEKCSELLEIDREAEKLAKFVQSKKSRIYENFQKMSSQEKSTAKTEIKLGLLKVQELREKKYELSCELEAFMGRVNNKVKKDVHDFRYELELENPECTYEYEKRFTEEFGNKKNALISKKDPEIMARSRTNTKSNILSEIWSVGRGSSRSRSGSIAGGALHRRLTVNTQTQLLLGRKRDRASSRGSSVHSPTPSTSRSTPRPSPVPISPAIRKYPRQSFSCYDTPETSASPQAEFDPNSTSMPAFAGVHESRHGRPRKLTTRVKQMLEQRVRGAQQVSSPLISQGCTAATINSIPRPSSHNSRRDSVASSSYKFKTHMGHETDNSNDGMDDDYDTEEEEEVPPEDEDEADDADESIWCICKTKAYGNMVACDNPQCRLEWFHYECVGMVVPPTGKWYCAECTQLGFQPSPTKH